MAPGWQGGWGDEDLEMVSGTLSARLPVGDTDGITSHPVPYDEDVHICNIGALEDMFASWPETAHLIVPMLVPCLPAIVHPALTSFPWDLGGEDEWSRVRRIVRESREADRGASAMDYDALAAMEGQSRMEVAKVGGSTTAQGASSTTRFSSLKQLLMLRKRILDIARDRARKQSRDDFRVSHDAQISILAWGVGICVGAMLAIFLSK